MRRAPSLMVVITYFGFKWWAVETAGIEGVGSERSRPRGRECHRCRRESTPRTVRRDGTDPPALNAADPRALQRAQCSSRQTSTETSSTGSGIGGSGLRRLHGHALGAELRREPVGDHRAQPLERLVRALLGDQRDHLADLAVVDRVLDAVGDQRVGLADVEADVEHEPLADLPLGGGDAVVRVEREADDLDRDADLGTFPFVVVDRRSGRLVVVVELGVVPGHRRRQRSSRHRERIERWRPRRGRGRRSRRARARARWSATVPATRSRHVAAGELAEERLARRAEHDGPPERDELVEPRGAARGCARASCRSRCRGRAGCAPRRTPSPTANASRSSRNALTSETTSS